MPNWLIWLIETGHIADLAIICLLLELAYFWRSKSGSQRLAVLFNTASGIAMLLALRAALTDAQLFWIPIGLSFSFVMHLIELRFRETS